MQLIKQNIHIFCFFHITLIDQLCHVLTKPDDAIVNTRVIQLLVSWNLVSRMGIRAGVKSFKIVIQLSLVHELLQVFSATDRTAIAYSKGSFKVLALF